MAGTPLERVAVGSRYACELQVQGISSTLNSLICLKDMSPLFAIWYAEVETDYRLTDERKSKTVRSKTLLQNESKSILGDLTRHFFAIS